MEKRYYSIESLEGELRTFEDHYGLSSEELVRVYAEGTCPEDVSSFDAMVWADAYAEVERLRCRQPQPA